MLAQKRTSSELLRINNNEDSLVRFAGEFAIESPKLT